MKQYNINDDMDYVMITSEQIEEAIKKLAGEIDRDYPDPEKKLLLLGILKGSVVVLGDLMKHIKRPVEIDFMKVSSYGGGTVSTKTINIMLDLYRHDISDLDILIVEDVVDSGRTLKYLRTYLLNKGAKSVKCATLLDKPSRREVDYYADYIGFTIEDKFVVGYGLDYDEKYRALPYIGVLKPEIYEK